MEDKDLNPDILTLVDEQGEEQQFEVVITTEEDGERYMGLVPAFQEGQELIDDDAELIILKVVADEEQDYLEAIENPEEFDKISKIFMEQLDELYDIIEEE